jgi:hypothetical protein
MYERDVGRLNVVMAYAGHMWFWSGADHARAQAMLDETRALLRDLVAAASGSRLPTPRRDMIALRVMAGYGIGVRDLYYGRSTLDEAIAMVVRFALE